MRFLITAIGSMSAETVVTSLRENFTSCKIIATDIYPAEWLYLENKVDAFYQIPKAGEEGYLQSIVEIVKSNDVDLVIPLTDPEVDVLSENRKCIEKYSGRLALCKDEVIKICRDKKRLSDYFVGNNRVKVIKSHSVDEIKPIKINFPAVAKLRKGRSSEGMRYITSFQELLILDENYIIQEFIDGPVITVDFVRDDWGNVVCLPRKELIRTSNGAGLSVEIFQDENIKRLITEISENMDITGCMNVEFIHSGDLYYLMDINPRFSAGIGFSILGGYDFVKNHINVFKKNRIEPAEKTLKGIAVKHYKEYMIGK